MIEKELIKIWQSSPSQEQVKFERSKLMIDVQSRVDQLHKGMKWLYLREGMGAAVSIPLFLVYAFIFPYTITKIACILIAVWAVIILFVIKRTKEKSPEQYTENYLEYLRKTKAYLDLQKRLREKIFSWYILPLFSLIYMFLLGFILGEPEKMQTFIMVGVIFLIAAIAIYFLNKRSAKKFIQPKLDKVNQLLSSLQE